MNTAPVEPSRRSRREAREAQPDEVTRDRSSRRDASSPGASEDSPGPVTRPATSGAWWMPVSIAVAALVVAVAVGLLITVAFDGASGRSLGGVVASVIVGATGFAMLPRSRPVGFFRLRALDVLWAVVLGAILPFIGGVFAGGGGWPAFAALSPRWLLLGVIAPFVSLVMLTAFGGLIVAVVLRALAGVSSVWARVASVVAAAVAFAIIPLVFRGDVSGMPVALPVVLGVAVAAFFALAQRLWGPLLCALVFTTVWVGMSAAGYILA